MNNKFKNAYIKYIDSFDKYLQLFLDNDTNLVINTSNEHFAHLVGKGHMPKYKNIPVKKFIDDIANGVINNDTLLKLNKKERSIIKKKLKAFDKLTTLLDSKVINKEMQISSLVSGDVFIHKVVDNHLFIMALKRVRSGVLYPTSIMWVDIKSTKSKKMIAEPSSAIIKIEKHNKFPKNNDN